MLVPGVVAVDLTATGLSYREEWSGWLARVFSGHSTSLVTLTFAARPWERDSVGTTGPTRSRVQRAAFRLEELLTRSLARPSWFIVREFGGMNGRAHLHCLISSEDSVVIREALARHQSREGFVSLRSCELSPVEYVTKYVSKSDSDWWRAGGPLWRI